MKVKCASCGRVLEPEEEDDREAEKEAKEVFPAKELEDLVVVCDPCFRRLRMADPELDAMYRGAGY